MELYNADCIRIMNTTMHNGSDQAPDVAKRVRVFLDIIGDGKKKFKDLWKEQYGIDLEVDDYQQRKPPPEYYTLNWQSYKDTLQSLISKIASSNSGISTVPVQWTPLNGMSSDGNPAFMKSLDPVKCCTRRRTGDTGDSSMLEGTQRTHQSR